MAKQKTNNTVTETPVEETTKVESLQGTDVTPPATELASPEALAALTNGAKQIQANGLKPERQVYPVVADDKGEVPMGDRDGYYLSTPVFNCVETDEGIDFVQGFLKVNLRGEETPEISIGVKTEVRDRFTGSKTERTDWRQYTLSQDQEDFWSKMRNSKESLAFVSALIISGQMTPLERPKHRSHRR